MVRIYVDSMVRIPREDLTEKVLRSLRIATTHRDPVYAKQRAMGYNVFGMNSHIKTHEITDTHLILWRGVLGDVIRACKRYGLPYQIIDNRLRLPRIEVTSTIQLRDYQVAPVAKMRKRQQTIIRAPAGSGKTEMLLDLVAKVRQPTLVLVWRSSQQRTWLKRIPMRFGFEPGGIGGAFKRPKIAPVTVGLVQSVRTRVEELSGLFGCVLCDEVQRFAAKTFSEVINQLPAAYRIGASDDERRKDDREFLLYDTFGPVGWELDETEGQCNVAIQAIPTRFELNDNEYTHTQVISALTRDPERNELILQMAERDAANGHRMLIFSDRVEHCKLLKRELLARGIRAGLIIGTKKYEVEATQTVQGLEDGTIQVGVGNVVSEESINVPPLDRAIMTCASVDYPKMTRFKQMRGRLARPYEGKESVLYYLWDRELPKLSTKLAKLKHKYEVTVVEE